MCYFWVWILFAYICFLCVAIQLRSASKTKNKKSIILKFLVKELPSRQLEVCKISKRFKGNVEQNEI